MKEFQVPEIDGRIAVSVEFAFAHPEYTYFAYNAEDAEDGLDPWRTIDCDLDKSNNRIEYILFDKYVQRGHIVYMQPPQEQDK